MQENLILVKEERLLLLRKLCQQQGEVDPNSVLPRSQSYINSPPINIDIITPKKSSKKRNSTDVSGMHCGYRFFSQKK